VKQHPDLLPNSSSAPHHNLPPAATAADLAYPHPSSSLEQYRPRRRAAYPTREIHPPSPTHSPQSQPWPLPSARHTTTATYAGPSTFPSSAPPSHPSERAPIWSHNSYRPSSTRASYPSHPHPHPHPNQPPTSAPHPSADLPENSVQNLPSFASTFGHPSAQPPARFPDSRQDAPQITVARSRPFDTSRPTSSYPPDSRHELLVPHTDPNSPLNTIANRPLPIHTTPPSNYTSQPTIQFGLPQEYDFRPFQRPAFSREPPAPRTQPGRNATAHHHFYPGNHTAVTQERVISPAQQQHHPPSPTPYPPVSLSLPDSTTTVESSHTHAYPVGDWRADYTSSRVTLMSHSMSIPRSSVPASSSRPIHAPPSLPTQPGSRPVPSLLHPYEALAPSGQETPGLRPVSPRRPSRGRGARGRQQGSRRARSDLASDATRTASQPRKRPRRNVEKAFDPTTMAQPPPMITITPAHSRQSHTGTGGAPERTPDGLQAMAPIPARPKRLILQTGPEDLPRVLELLTQETHTAATRNRHMKKVRLGTSFRLISVARLADRMGRDFAF
jgi:hypothetical protein